MSFEDHGTAVLSPSRSRFRPESPCHTVGRHDLSAVKLGLVRPTPQHGAVIECEHVLVAPQPPRRPTTTRILLPHLVDPLILQPASLSSAKVAQAAASPLLGSLGSTPSASRVFRWGSPPRIPSSPARHPRASPEGSLSSYHSCLMNLTPA